MLFSQHVIYTFSLANKNKANIYTHFQHIEHRVEDNRLLSRCCGETGAWNMIEWLRDAVIYTHTTFTIKSYSTVDRTESKKANVRSTADERQKPTGNKEIEGEDRRDRIAKDFPFIIISQEANSLRDGPSS